MNFIKFLQKHFDCQTQSFFDDSIIGTNNTGKDVSEIWLYEKDNDCEPLLILRDNWWYSDSIAQDEYLVLNVYSNLSNRIVLTEAEIRKLITKGKIHSQYKK